MKYFSVIQLKKFPMVCHVPHSSTIIPGKYRPDFLIGKKELEQEAKKLADLYTRELYRPLLREFGGVVFGVSRIVVDPERFENDSKEEMAKVGMGVLYTKTESGRLLRRIEARRREEYLNKIYRPYQLALSRSVKGCLRKFGRCLIIDCHSFPARPRRYDRDKTAQRPDICLGTDKFHTPGRLVVALSKAFRAAGFSVKVNQPFRGAMVPLDFYRRDKRVRSILVEVNRALYMDEKRFSKQRGFARISRTVSRIVSAACHDYLQKTK